MTHLTGALSLKIIIFNVVIITETDDCRCDIYQKGRERTNYLSNKRLIYLRIHTLTQVNN